MVKVAAPAMSLEASGSLGQAITFSRWKGRPYIRTRVVPKNPKSAAQTGMRAMLRWLSQAWAALTTANKATWANLAAATNISPFNSYTAYNQARWRDWRAPTKAYPAAEALTAGTISNLQVTSGERSNTLTWEEATMTNTWGIAICRYLVSETPANWSITIRIVPPAVLKYVDSPVDDPTSWYYRLIAFTTDGKFGVQSGESQGS